MNEARRSELEARIEASVSAAPLHERICHESVPILSVSTAALIVMSEEESGALVVASDDGAAAVEDLQFSLGEGPCLQAYEERKPVLEPDLMDGAASKWPTFVAAATKRDVRAVFALPLQLGAIRLGVFYLTRRKRGSLSDDELGDAFVLAEMATVALLSKQEGAVAGELGAGLDGAWAHRAVVHQATGMVSAQLSIPIDKAMTRLRAHAENDGGDIYRTARAVVEGQMRIEP